MHATAEEARAETVQMLEVYASFHENDLAIPVVKGCKTPSDKFAGAEDTYAIDLAALCRTIGVPNVIEVSSFDVVELERIIKESTASDILTVIIAKAPCVLLKGQKFPNKCIVNPDACKKCGLCMKIGCPAMSKGEDGKVKIDPTMCNGCGLCKNYCKFNAIEIVEK